MRFALRLVWVGLLVTAGFITLVGQSGLETANGNVCSLWKAVSHLPFVTCHLENLLVPAWVTLLSLAALLILIDIALAIRKKFSPAAAPLIAPSAPSAPRIEIAYGEDEPYEKLTAATTSRLDRLLLLEFKNPFSDRAITGCKLEVVSIEPFMGARRPFVLLDNLSLAGGDHVFIPFVSYGESRNTVDRSPIADTAKALLSPKGETPHFLAALPHDVESVLTLRATAMETSVCEAKVVVWVGAGTRLRIRKFEGSTDDLFIPLEDAASETYGLSRHSDIGGQAEKSSTGPLTWFAWYYHVRNIPIFGNVRNSDRIEPVLFRNADISTENRKLIVKERYSDLVWENLKVRNADQARMRQIAVDHARELANG
jgi:hypothetical protein